MKDIALWVGEWTTWTVKPEKKLHEKEAAATEAVGRYSRSLKGVAPAPEHRKEMDRLQRELAKAGVDYSQHKEQCAVCQCG